MTNVKYFPKHGKLTPVHRRELPQKESIANKLTALQNVNGLISDLTPQDIKEFDSAVKRSPLFNQ